MSTARWNGQARHGLFYLGVMTVGSYDKACRQGLAALLLTALLGAGTLAQAEEAAPEGKVEARSELFAKDHADQFTSWKGLSLIHI